MYGRVRIACWLSAMVLALTVASLGQSGHLEFADRPRLVHCDPVISRPCFRLRINAVDAGGNPLETGLAPDQDLRERVKVTVDDLPLRPFFAVSEENGAATVHSRLTVILLDTSGSMNLKLTSGETRFQAAKRALDKFVENFQNSVDRVAIVPFESHGVQARFRSALFASTREEAERQISELPSPAPRNNTALYTAVGMGLELLLTEARIRASGPDGETADTQLIVMTDGKNEVYRGDDPGLADGPSGLEQAAAKVRQAGLQVVAIGFGDPGQVDVDALHKIGAKVYLASDAQTLDQVFTAARRLETSRIRATFASPYEDRSSLAGKTLRVRIFLRLPDNRTLASGAFSWEPPEMGTPVFEGKCDTEELTAALKVPGPGPGNRLAFLRPARVFVLLGVLLLVLWFLVPRLVWPDPVTGSSPNAGGYRWADFSRSFSRSAPRRMPSRPVPPGFETTGRGPRGIPRRGSADPTVVQPQVDFSRSRVEKRPYDSGDL